MMKTSLQSLLAVTAIFAHGCAVSSQDDGTEPTGSDLDTAGSRCRVSALDVFCEHQVLSLSDSLVNREVAYELPRGTPPENGWPVVIYYQGSFVPGSGAFSASVLQPFGVYDLALTIKALLDDGYAVIAPDATLSGTTFWQTNIAPYSISWSNSPDDIFVQNLLSAVDAGTFGPLDASRLYAMGISSGGFMTSRMAISYPGRFRALADHSGSYATCSALCFVPTPLPADHPPTLFLHGDLDLVVPITAVRPYLDALQAEGHEAKLVTDLFAGHRWLRSGPQEIPAWFDAHP